MKSAITSLRLSHSLAERLDRAAKRLARGKSWIINRALEEYLARSSHEELATQARRQSLLAGKRGRGSRQDRFWDDHGDLSGWK